MSSTEKLEWWVDSREYELFREYVEEKHGVIGLCFPSEVVQAMRAFIDKDRAAAVEDELTALEDALAGTLPGYSRRRRSLDPLAKDDLGGEDTKKVRCEVPAALKEEFAIYIEEHSEWGKGEALGRAMNAYRDGGREQRLADRLEEMTAAVESSDIDARDAAQNDESDDEKNPYSVDDKLEAIRDDILDRWPEPVDELGEIEGKVPVAWVDESVDRWCTKGNRKEATEKTKKKYYNLLADEFGFVKDGQNFTGADLDDPAFERKPYRELSTEERIEAIHVQLLREADKNRRYQVSAAYIREEYLDGGPDDSTAHSLREKAADTRGFKPVTVRGKEKLRVAPSDVPDELREKAGLTTQDDDAESEEIKQKAEAKMAALDQGTPARAHGGTESY